MPTLSVVMIIKNEEKWLKTCLDSVKHIADEIVITDTGSDDKSLEIAQQFGAKIFHIEWKDDFAWARNESLKPATGDWLLLIDADEILAPEGAIQIRNIVDNNGGGINAFDLIQANYCSDIGSWRWKPVPKDAPLANGNPGYVASPLTRLFRNHMGYEFRGCVHETINTSIFEKGHRIESTNIIIHHYGLELGDYSRQKSAKYLSLCRKKVKQTPEDAKSWLDLATRLVPESCLEEACKAAQNALRLSPSLPDAVFTLTNIYLQQANWQDARRTISPLLENASCRFKAQLVLATIDTYEGKFEDAEKQFKELRRICTTNVSVNLEYARLLDIQGNTELAEKLLVECCEHQPRLEKLNKRYRALQLRQKGEAAFEKSARGALKAFVSALQLDPRDPLIFNNIGVVLHALGDTENAKDNFERALLLAPFFTEAKQNLNALQC